MHTIKLLISLVEHHQVFAYFLIFIGLVFEGEITLIFTGVLAHLGALNFWWALVFIFTGGAVKTIGGYYLGVWLYAKYNHHKLFQYIEKRVLSFMPNFRERPFWSVFFSKFIIGMNYLTIIFSGYERNNFKNYLKAEALSTLIWAPSVLCLGYFFSYYAFHVSREISKFSLVILTFIIIFILFDKLVALFYRIFEYFKNSK